MQWPDVMIENEVPVIKVSIMFGSTRSWPNQYAWVEDTGTFQARRESKNVK